MLAATDNLFLMPPLRQMRRFAAIWRDEETGSPRQVVVAAPSSTDAAELLAELIDHTNFEMLEV